MVFGSSIVGRLSFFVDFEVLLVLDHEIYFGLVDSIDLSSVIVRVPRFEARPEIRWLTLDPKLGAPSLVMLL